MTADARRDELLHAAANRQLWPKRDGRIMHEGRDVAAEVAALAAAGLLDVWPRLRLPYPTDAGRAAYAGPDRCPHCDAWPQVEWLGERGTRHAYRCANGHRWETPMGDTSMSNLPTPAAVLRDADNELSRVYALLGDAADGLRSDTSTSWTAEQADRKRAMFRAIGAAKDAINEAR